MLAKWREQEKKEENELLWHNSTCFLILTWRRKKCSSACRLISQHSLYPNSFGQALWNRNLCLRSHRSCFDRGSLLNVANDDRESCTRGPSRFASRATLHIHIFQKAETLSCQHSNRLPLLHLMDHLWLYICFASCIGKVALPGAN